MKRLPYILILTAWFLISGSVSASAQHTFAVTGGTGFASSRLYPNQETKSVWGKYQAGISWRYYSLPRFVGCIGLDLEWIQAGFSYAPYASIYEKKSDYKYYTRSYNTLMIPFVWQPHFYFAKHHVRVYLEAALTLSVNFSASFDNREPFTFGSAQGTGVDRISGTYHMRTERDNRFCYGLAGGGGVDLLFGQMEIGVRVRYNLGYGDIMRNRSQYYDNTLDQVSTPGENPFWYTPIRSPLDSFMISLKIGWRFNKEGFREWTFKRLPKVPKSDSNKFGL